jgi:hypothetical protein
MHMPKALIVEFASPAVRKRKAAQAQELRLARQLLLPHLEHDELGVVDRVVERATDALADAELEWGPFVMVQKADIQGLVDAADRTGRPAAALKLILVSVANLGRDQATIALSRAELAKQCRIPATHVSAVMAELAEWNVVAIEKIGRSVVYRFNPSIAWSGKPTARAAAVAEFPVGRPGPRLVEPA